MVGGVFGGKRVEQTKERQNENQDLGGWGTDPTQKIKTKS
jgi:hypothetical protein